MTQMHGKLSKLKKRVTNEIGTILIILGCALSTACILFIAWKIFYDSPKFRMLKWLHSPGEAPSLEGGFLLLLALVGLAFGALLRDMHILIIGYLISQILSLLFASFFGFYYNWFVRGACADPIWGSVPFAWEYVFFMVLTDMFRMIFPLASVYCFLSAIFGNLLINFIRK